MQGGKHSDMELRLRTECERGFKVGAKTPSALEFNHTGLRPDVSKAPTGEPFKELINPDLQRRDSDQAAYDLALATFHKYAATRGPGTLYWRTYPEVENGKFYMRLLISDKPVLQSAKK